MEGQSRSGVARLNLPEGTNGGIPAPRIFNVKINNGKLEMQVGTVAQHLYTLQYCNSAEGGRWSNAQSLNGTGGTITLSDPSPNNPRFYRIAVQ